MGPTPKMYYRYYTLTARGSYDSILPPTAVHTMSAAGSKAGALAARNMSIIALKMSLLSLTVFLTLLNTSEPIFLSELNQSSRYKYSIA